MATRTWPQWRPGGRQAGWTCPARRPKHIAGGRRKQAPQEVQVALLRPALARGPSRRSLRKECLPLPPQRPRWRQVGPPPCAGRLCSSPPHPLRLWPHLHVEPLRCGAPPLCLQTLAMPSSREGLSACRAGLPPQQPACPPRLWCHPMQSSHAAASSQQSVQLGAEHCGDGPRCRVTAAVLAVLVTLLPGPLRRRRCSALVPPPPRSNRQSWRCGQRHLPRSGLPQTWALALARALAGEGAGPSCPKATARPRLTGRRQLPQRSGRLSLPLLPAPAGAPTGERAGRGPSPHRRRR